MKNEAPYFDKNGEEIKEFAVIKLFHFKGVNKRGNGRKNYYMYKWIRLIEEHGKKKWVALHLTDNSGNHFSLSLIANTKRMLVDAEIVQQY